MSAVADVIAYLAATGLVDGSTSWTSSPRLVHDEVDRLVVVAEDGGPAPELGGGSFDGPIRTEGVRVVVRGSCYEGDAAAAKATEIRDALHGLAGETLGATRYEGVWAMTSAPVWIGFDENRRPEFSTGFRLMSPAPV